VSEILAVAVLCLSASTAALASSIPFLWWKCFRLEFRLQEQKDELQKQIDTVDEALARLLESVGVPAERKDSLRSSIRQDSVT